MAIRRGAARLGCQSPQELPLDREDFAVPQSKQPRAWESVVRPSSSHSALLELDLPVTTLGCVGICAVLHVDVQRWTLLVLPKNCVSLHLLEGRAGYTVQPPLTLSCPVLF